ncbi:hypothetical protein AJ80_04151 [Polytolypa hystricis UAMH7299]|uniref:Uncharacterized protein n=1 Tax=Polytolypa hystricis (strain UAMH7299) TaxID=1447883 RepID=A0A2B7YE74_POLH7|nr:hypothetical protein AJ80_04151 [Polytolypa hystricis UAMH7299]
MLRIRSLFPVLFCAFILMCTSLANSPNDNNEHQLAPRSLQGRFPPHNPPQNITITRCRAEELSQGEALWILLVLAVACVVHIPGSVTILGHKGLYRLAPELGIVETAAVLVLVVRGKFYHKQTLRRSIKATLALRHALGEGESWWLKGLSSGDRVTRSFTHSTLDTANHYEYSVAISPAEANEYLDPFLSTLRNSNQVRFLGSILTTLALIKACAVTGTVRTTVLACSYYFSFFMIELLALVALEPGQPPSKGELETEAIACAQLMAALDPFKHEIRNTLRWVSVVNEPPEQWYASYAADSGTTFEFPEISHGAESGARAISRAVPILAAIAFAIVHLAWPVSVPLFLVNDFTFIRTGKWTFAYLNSIVWLFWTSVAALVMYIFVVIFSILRRKPINELAADNIPRTWKKLNLFISAYVALKVALIFRLFLTDYTGQNTRRPDWAEWLG